MKTDILSFAQKSMIVILLLAMLSAAIFFSLQSDFLLTCLTVQELAVEGSGDSFRYFEQKKFDRIYGKLSPVEQKFVTGMHRDNPTEWAREIYESDPENILYVSLYAAAFAAEFSKEEKPEIEPLRKVISQWKKLEPDNAMPYFFLSYAELETGYKTEFADNSIGYSYTVRDMAAIERGIKEYREGLQKKFAKTHAGTRLKERLRLANLKHTPHEAMEKMKISAATLLFHLVVERNLARMLSEYAKMIHAKGKTQEAVELTASGKSYLLLRLEKEETYLISILVHIAINEIWLNTAKELNLPELVRVYAPASEDFKRWKEQPDPAAESVKKHGGILASMLLPALRKEIDPELLTPERMLNYILVDQIVLFFLCSMVVAFLLFLFLLGLLGICLKKYPVWEIPLKSWLRVFLFGWAIPLAVYLICIHVDFLSGRDMNPAWNPLHTVVPYLYILFLFPLIFFITALIEVRFHLKRPPFARLWNMIAFLIVFLFLTSVILAPLYRAKISYYLERDELCWTDDGFTSVEAEVTRDLIKNLHQNLTNPQRGNMQ